MEVIPPVRGLDAKVSGITSGEGVRVVRKGLGRRSRKPDEAFDVFP